jgi:hypothetical protein
MFFSGYGLKTTKPASLWCVAFETPMPTEGKGLSWHKKHDPCPILTTLLKLLSGISLIPIDRICSMVAYKLMIDKE